MITITLLLTATLAGECQSSRYSQVRGVSMCAPVLSVQGVDQYSEYLYMVIVQYSQYIQWSARVELKNN